MNSNVYILFSGGIDSSCCLHFLKKEHSTITGLFIDYGQKSNKKEYEAAKNISNYYKIPLVKITHSSEKSYNEGPIWGRNAFLLFSALMYLNDEACMISMGVHGGTDYVDCDGSFIKDIQNLFDTYTGGVIEISTPFLKFTKKQILEYAKEENVPINLTYSCELGLEQPCGKCLSCQTLEKLSND